VHKGSAALIGQSGVFLLWIPLLMSIAKILIAEDQRALPYVRQALAGYELLLVPSLQDAERMTLEGGIDLFILGIHFDDSRATELANAIRRSAAHATTPIILVRILPSTIEKFIRSSTNALKASGIITDFLEFQKNDEIASKLKQSVEAHLPADKIVAAGLFQ
jgi:response regulator RpfG family c-di-GMP phosphodiesterase